MIGVCGGESGDTNKAGYPRQADAPTRYNADINFVNISQVLMQEVKLTSIGVWNVLTAGHFRGLLQDEDRLKDNCCELNLFH